VVPTLTLPNKIRMGKEMEWVRRDISKYIEVGKAAREGKLPGTLLGSTDFSNF
jgi:predicted DNA-binding transcriptional regulator AlpA